MNKIYEMVTEKMIALLEKGVVPWQKPWRGSAVPKNIVSKRAYEGINIFLLGYMPYDSPWWMTYHQANDLRGYVKKDEKGSLVVYWKLLEVDPVTQKLKPAEIMDLDVKTNEKKHNEIVPLLRYYTVFNFEQVSGVKDPDEGKEKIIFKPIEKAEQIANGMPDPPTIIHQGARAYYTPSTDTLKLPKKERFQSEEEYYGALFHELSHSTGHEKRLNRKTLVELCPYGTTNYSKEELVAEMGAAFLCAHAGIENTTMENSASYIGGWLKALADDKTMVVHAASQAQKAADYVLGRKEAAKEASP